MRKAPNPSSESRAEAPALGRSRRYVLITPCMNEAEDAKRTLESVAAPTIPPALWVVVDDGSTDATSSILAEYAARPPYLRIVHKDHHGARRVGPEGVEAFYAGFATPSLTTFPYPTILD